MNVHNIMEDMVSERISDLYAQVKKMNSPWLTCDCEHCRLNTISYVLNRIPSKYIVSGRGLTYISSFNDHQLRADIDSLGIEGMRLVSAAKRPYHDLIKAKQQSPKSSTECVFNFPTFIGNVFDGNTFEPISGAVITLYLDDKIATTIDGTWQNPCKTFLSTKAGFSFWVKCLPAEEEGISKQFHFSLSISADGYEKLVHNFYVTVTSEIGIKQELNTALSLKFQELYLFPAEEDMSAD